MKIQKSTEDKFADGMMAFLLFITGVCLLISILGLIGSIVAGVDKSQFIADNQCTLASKVKTGERVYCGKACMRDEYKSTYLCTPENANSFEKIYME